MWIIYHAWVDGVSGKDGLLDRMRLSKIERSRVNLIGEVQAEPQKIGASFTFIG